MVTTREFRPLPKPSLARTILGLVFGGIMLVGAVLLGAIAVGSGQITYVIENGRLSVASGSVLDGSRSFSLNDVVEARIVDLRGARKMRGTNAPGFCTGLWWYEEIGEVWQATSCARRGVVVRATGEERPIVITPPDLEAFLQAMTDRTDTVIPLPGDNTLILKVLPLVAAALFVVAAGMMIALCIVGPQRMRYLVGDGQLEVQTIFSRKSWPASSLRARRHVPKVTLRVAGAALPGYYTGIFRVDGTNTRVYATDLQSGVLIEGPARVLLTPEDPEAFLTALREAGAG